MQGQFEIGFSLQYSPNVMVRYAAHVIGCSDRATIVAPIGNIAASIGPIPVASAPLGKPYLVGAQRTSRASSWHSVSLRHSAEGALSPARVRLFSHTIRRTSCN